MQGQIDSSNAVNVLLGTIRKLPRGTAMAIAGCLAMALCAIAAAFLIALSPLKAEQGTAGDVRRSHMGVASCAGSTCHGRSIGDGTPVSQNEILRWQEESSPSGAHSRAYRVIREPRGVAIIRRMGLNEDGVRKECLGCHSSPGVKRIQEGVDCETCHGSAGGWIATHYTVGATHARNVSQGMTDLSNPRVRAGVCLDCHLSGDGEGQFVAHRIMAAGHPRVSFEMDLFSTLQQHWTEDADYAQRKGKTSTMRNWAVGQAEAVKRSLTLFSQPGLAQDGVFPEFYFYDCHSCHRRIYDNQDGAITKSPNPGRPIPAGMPPYNDENMIMLLAAAKVAAPDLAGQFDARSKAFHAAMVQGRGPAVQAAGALRQTADALSDRFAGASFSREQTFSIMSTIASDAIAARFTDYEGAVQSVMAIDTLLNGLVNQGAVSEGAAKGLRSRINQAYAAVREPNGFQQAAFRRALGGAVASIRSLR
ncbi:MAG: multiheme c-type cytochrome [Novosphingobium sp.]|nr:multiheme c-type cytochrome [Novosphingobium sp.]